MIKLCDTSSVRNVGVTECALSVYEIPSRANESLRFYLGCGLDIDRYISKEEAENLVKEAERRGE